MSGMVCIMQPTYLPWCGYLDMVDQADLFILLDTVPVDTKSWQTRNRVLNRQGNEVWLSIPTHAHQGQLLEFVEIAEDGKWRRKHRGTLNALSKGRPELQPLLALYEQELHDHLVPFTHRVLLELCLALKINTPLVLASAYGLPVAANPIQRIVDLCEHTGARELLNTAGARAVLNVEKLPVGSGEIPVRYHEYTPQPYGQNGNGFTSHLSVVDCLARHGAEETLGIIRAGRAKG